MKKFILTAIPCLITVGILIWLFHDPVKRADMALTIRNADPRWLLLGILMYGGVEVAGITRWYLFLRVQGVKVGFIRTGALFMVGLFFNSALPGATGGDAVKIFYLLKEARGKGAIALLSVVMDRLVGLLALILVAVVLIVLRYDWLIQAPSTEALLKALIIFLGTILGVIAFSFLMTGFGLQHKLPKRMPLRDKLIEMAAAYNVYGRAWKISLFGFILSIPIHLGYFLTFYCAARALKANTGLLDFMAIMPIVAVGTSLPISFAGIGWREKLFEDLLGKLCGVPASTAILVGSTGFLMIFFWSLIGGIIYIFYRPSTHASLSEISHEIKDLEHTIVEREENK